MIIKNKKPYILSVLILIASLTFKYKTGSFFTISKQSEIEVVKYEMKKRKKDITLFSLSNSCTNINDLGKALKTKIISQAPPCVNTLVNPQTPSDSVVYIVLQKALEYTTYNKSKLSNKDERITWLYHMNQEERIDSFALVFQKINEAYLITNILYIESFLTVHCK